MHRKGFTLIELLAVVSLVAILTIILLPTVINQVNGSKDEVSEEYQKIMFQATELYMDKFKNVYPMEAGRTYCIPLKNLVDEGYLDEPLKDPATKKEIEVLTEVNGTYQAKTKIEVVVTGPIDAEFRFIDENAGDICTEK